MGRRTGPTRRVRYPARVSDTFPRQYARTQRLTLGEPRGFTVSPDGGRVLFARSTSGSDPINRLWLLDTATGLETMVLDPTDLDGDLNSMTEAERRRRERAREGAGGVVTYSCDHDVRRAVTVLGGIVVMVDVTTGQVRIPPIEPGVFDVRLSPDGNWLSYVRDRALCVAGIEGHERIVAEDPADTVSWGVAEFIAAEEMGRFAGYWWSPDSRMLAACRVDVAPVATWHIGDAANPDREPEVHRYPRAGSANAEVSLHLIDVGTGTSNPVDFPGDVEYLNQVAWSEAGLIAQTQTRDQRRIDIWDINPTTATASHRLTDTDAAWIELVPGLPRLLPDGQVLSARDIDGARRLCIEGRPVTPVELQCRSVVSAAERIVFVANRIDTPWSIQVFSLDPSTARISEETAPGAVASAHGHRDCLVVREGNLESTSPTFTVRHRGSTRRIDSHAETALVAPRVRIATVGSRAIPVAIITPDDAGDDPLPVLFDPYGGPHAQRVLATGSAYLSSQWFADQGFIVVVADNVGTPGKGSDWERGVRGDLAGPVLADQIEVLEALATLEPRADVSRVGIRGWSFGGYLAALAVLRRSDVFHAAIAGAPVTDWALYDTHYTERYLGIADNDPTPYDATSLFNDVDRLESPLLLIHGLADDNVVAAHTLRLSSVLLAAGKQHEVLPLSGVTHMTPQEVVAENLLLHQLRFLRTHLVNEPTPPAVD